MTQTGRRRAWIGLLTGALAAATSATLPPAAAMAADPAGGTARVQAADTRPVPEQITKGKLTKLQQPDQATQRAMRDSLRPRTRAAAPQIGDTKIWPALDNVRGLYYLKQYTLRGIGANIEIWVASGPTPAAENLDFPPGDCRNGPRTQVTDAQVTRFISEFDTNIYPKESRFYSVPPARGGTAATLPGQVGLPADYWTGDADNIVTLVDNVRDENFYDRDNASQFTYIAGFFSSTFNGWLDRNVMTVDGFDWLHRTGPNPPDEPSTDPCTNAPARPNLYEGVFAHEYQHLLMSYADADEVSWVDEGLADYAQTLTGYADTTRTIQEKGFDNHVQCFLGWLARQSPANPIPRAACGPENSLTNWNDQGPAETLADYGATYTLMSYLATRYGPATLSALHRHPANGLAGLQAVLDRRAPGVRAQTVLHQWAAMVALDEVLDGGARLTGGAARTYSSDLLHASIDWANPQAYNSPGAPANGSDYVQPRDKSGGTFSADEIRSLTFDGANLLPTTPVEWTVDPAARPGNPALYSGTADNADRAIVAQVTVPAATPTLTFDAKWDTEPLWDFGFVQVSTDGGKTYKSLAATDTTSEHDPGADARIVANLPGFTGSSADFRAQTVDLAGYAGQTVLLAFRYMSDTNVNGLGFWVDNVRVGATLVSDGGSLAAFRSPDEITPKPVAGWTVQLVGYTADGARAYVADVPLTSDFTRSLNRAQIRRMLGSSATVGVVVMQDDPAEAVLKQARYTLTVNGIVQPGG